MVEWRTDPHMENRKRIKFWLPDEVPKSDRKLPEKATRDEFCDASAKSLPVIDVSAKEGISDIFLPLDVLVQIVLKLRHDELEPLSGVSTMVRGAVAGARKMHFDYNTPVRCSTCRSASKMPPTPIPKHAWKPRMSGIEGLKAPIIRIRKRKREHMATSPRSPSTTRMGRNEGNRK